LATVTYYSDTCALADRGLFERLYSTVSDYRRSKIDGYIFDKDKRLSLGVELLLRKALEDMGEDADLSCIDTVANGKPVIRGSDFHFNLSHSEERVMCSVSDSDVGCDVERIQPIDLDIARRYFYGTEYDAIASESLPDSRYDLFYRFWTLKESFMKVTGLGFELELDRFRISLGDPITVDQTVDAGPYHFREYFVDDGYRYACCSRSDDFEPEMRRVDLGKMRSYRPFGQLRLPLLLLLGPVGDRHYVRRGQREHRKYGPFQVPEEVVRQNHTEDAEHPAPSQYGAAPEEESEPDQDRVEYDGHQGLRAQEQEPVVAHQLHDQGRYVPVHDVRHRYHEQQGHRHPSAELKNDSHR